jgi:rhamnopyranosyl-N-acetylglucosaminyl-diphospho-decaprenol beta-1,3/1,4-galactofuranosyltransferase
MEGLTVDDESATTVCAVVVTYNRHDLLLECLDRVQRQSRQPDHVLVVDNASNDETPEMLARREGVEVLTLEENIGSAGGFAEGVRVAHGGSYDWLWLLDDDTFCDETCLEALLAGIRRAPREASVMCSVVRWRDGTLHPMNRPWLRFGRREEFAEAGGAGLALIRSATWVSTMIRREAVDEHGLPPAHFFVWSDDRQYIGGVLRNGTGYVVPESIAWHWTPEAHDTVTDTRGRFYYRARNQLWVLRGSSFQGVDRVFGLVGYVKGVITYVRRSPSKSRALRTVGRGIRDGLRRPPT